MELMGCLGCEGVYAVGLPVCPRCGTVSPRYEGVEDAVPKVTVGGASNDDASDAREEAPVAQSPPGPEPAAQGAPVEDAAPPMVSEGGYAGASGMAALVPPGASTSMLTPADEAAGYTDLSFAELRAEAKSRGLPAGGSAVELAARLADHDAAAEPAVTPEGGG